MIKIGADERIRTSDHFIRSEVLYPAELRPHILNKKQPLYAYKLIVNRQGTKNIVQNQV